MLFILFGATLEMGYQSRVIFEENNFEIIKKYNYVENSSPVDKSGYENPNASENTSKWYNDKVYVDESILAELDFKYSLNGVHIGFNKDQIIDAIHGTKDCLLTSGASSLDFVMQLKRAYGDYLTVIYLFIDRNTALKDMNHDSKDEHNARIKGHDTMQQLYLENTDKFDEIVLYSGEGTVYNLAALRHQYRSIIQKRKKIEDFLNSKRKVQLPYTGAEPYLFVSYSHKDSRKVIDILTVLQNNNYRIWYDDGINGGENWRKIIANKISECETVLLFSSENSATSPNVGAEISGALMCEKNIITLRLDEARFGLEDEMYLQRTNNLFAGKPDFEQKLLKALPLSTKMSS